MNASLPLIKYKNGNKFRSPKTEVLGLPDIKDLGRKCNKKGNV